MGRKGNGDGSTRQLADGSWECLVQSKYPNPKTGNPKRIKRKAATEKEAIEKAKMALTASQRRVRLLEHWQVIYPMQKPVFEL